ncbi:hypothetical protein AgCh_022553 [Apium graveolens]
MGLSHLKSWGESITSLSQDYESFSEDEGDNHDEGKDEPTDPTDLTNPNEGSSKPGQSKPGQKRKGTKKRTSKAWDTFDELPIGEDKVLIPTYIVVCEPDAGTSLQMAGLDVMKEFDALERDLNPVEKTELEKYLEEKRLNKSLDIDILEYWNSNQFRFPNFALMARDILSIPISTVRYICDVMSKLLCLIS